jgi:hypothetical protein
VAFHWEADDYRSQDFRTRVDAEAWLTECYPDLVDAGVQAVTLYSDADPVYGPMSLLA